MDLLAEYAYNNSPYNYVKNNPINYIDLFGLSDTTYIAPEPIPEVVVTYTPPPKLTFSSFISILYAIDDLLMGNYNPSKIHDATKSDNWLIRTFDMSEVKRLGEIFGRPGFEGTNNNKVRSNESYQGRTEDIDIKKENTGTGPETNSFVRTSTNTDSIDIIYHKHNGLKGGQIVRQRIPINDTSKYHILQRSRVRK